MATGKEFELLAETKEEGIQVFNSNKKKEFELLAQARQKNKSF